VHSQELVFYIDEWIDEEDYEILKKFARYLGRDYRGSKFVIDVNRLVESLRKGEIKPNDVIDILTGYDAEFVTGSMDTLMEILNKYIPRISIKRVGHEILLQPSTYLGDIIKDLRESGILRYDKDRKVFVLTKPMYFFEVVHTLRSRGLEVVDETGFKERIPLPIKPTFRGSLREYQKEALEAWRRNNYRGVISLPTGAGKTVIAIAAICELSIRTLIVTYTKEQMFQWEEKLLEFTDIPRYMIGLFYGESKRVAPITIATYQSAFRYIDMLSPYFSLLIVDEAHHLPADKFKHIAENAIARYRMALSATVVREDGKHTELFALMGGLVYHKSATALADEGYLAPFKIITVKVSLTPDEKLRYRRLLEEYKKLAAGRTFEELLTLAKHGDTKAIEAIRIRSELRQLVHNAAEKLEAVKKIVNYELSRDSKILIFTQYVDQAKRIAEYIGAYYITGELDESARKRRLAMFRNGDIRVLVLTTVGDEGIDIPDANVGIIVAGTSSRRQFIQRLGRLLRPAPGKEARLYEIVVKDTFEEFESKRRRQILSLLLDNESIES